MGATHAWPLCIDNNKLYSTAKKSPRVPIRSWSTCGFFRTNFPTANNLKTVYNTTRVYTTRNIVHVSVRVSSVYESHSARRCLLIFTRWIKTSDRAKKKIKNTKRKKLLLRKVHRLRERERERKVYTTTARGVSTTGEFFFFSWKVFNSKYYTLWRENKKGFLTTHRRIKVYFEIKFLRGL